MNVISEDDQLAVSGEPLTCIFNESVDENENLITFQCIKNHDSVSEINGGDKDEEADTVEKDTIEKFPIHSRVRSTGNSA